MALCLPNLALPFAARAEDAQPKLINVKVVGSGPKTVVFIPGLATPGAIWDDTIAHLPKDTTYHVVSIAGFGGLAPVKSEHFLVDVRDEIIGYIRAQKLDHPVIVGHSLGGVLGLDLAAKAPELPGRLVIVDSLPFLAAMMGQKITTEADAKQVAMMYGLSISMASPEMFAEQQKQFIGSMVTSPEKAAAIAAMTGKSDPAATGQAMSELLGRDLRPELSAIKCPVLVLGSLVTSMSAGMTGENAEKAYRAQYVNLPQTRFQFFDHAKHFIMVDDPESFQKALISELGQ